MRGWNGHARPTSAARVAGRGGRPESGTESHYLLTGFLACSVCGGGMSATWRSGSRGERKAYYRCNTHRMRGEHICDNALTVPLPALEASVLRTLREAVLTPDLIDDVITRAIEPQNAKPAELAERRQALTREAGRLAGELRRLTEGIRLGGPLASLVEALRAAEGRRAEVLAQLEHLDGVGRVAKSGLGDLRRQLLTANPVDARPVLRNLLEGRLTMTPKREADGRWYAWSGHATYGGILAGLLRVQSVVPPG
jgi:hypothetical protein